MANSGALFGDTGSGKTTQGGELMIDMFKRIGKRSILNTCDRGGYKSIEHLQDLGIMRVNELGPDDNVWDWIDSFSSGKNITDDIGLILCDSGTAMGEALLTAITKDPNNIGSQRTQRFRINNDVSVALNNESHYGLVQSFLLDAIWKSTWLTRKGIDVWWTFSVHRGENPSDTPILGPKLAGKALTAAIPKWFTYCFRIDTVPATDTEEAKHVLYLQPKTELGGLGFSFSNARFAMGSQASMTKAIEPASVVEALKLIEDSKEEATARLRAELGL